MSSKVRELHLNLEPTIKFDSMTMNELYLLQDPHITHGDNFYLYSS